MKKSLLSVGMVLFVWGMSLQAAAEGAGQVGADWREGVTRLLQRGTTEGELRQYLQEQGVPAADVESMMGTIRAGAAEVEESMRALTVQQRELTRAITNNDTRRVREMLDQGIDPNFTVTGATPLIIAASLGNKDIVEYLLEKGADRDKKDNAGLTAADYAERKGHRRVADILRRALVKRARN